MQAVDINYLTHPHAQQGWEGYKHVSFKYSTKASWHFETLSPYVSTQQVTCDLNFAASRNSHILPCLITSRIRKNVPERNMPRQNLPQQNISKGNIITKAKRTKTKLTKQKTYQSKTFFFSVCVQGALVRFHPDAPPVPINSFYYEGVRCVSRPQGHLYLQQAICWHLVLQVLTSRKYTSA